MATTSNRPPTIDASRRRAKRYADDFKKSLGELLRNADQQTSTHIGSVESAVSSVQEAAQAALEGGVQQSIDEGLDELAQAQERSQRMLSEQTRISALAADDAWGGDYEQSAKHDHNMAGRLRWAAFACYAGALGVAAALVLSLPDDPPEQWEWDWLIMRPVLAAPVVILLWVAAYASRESREHRVSARLAKQQALVFVSLHTYIDRITSLHKEGYPDASQTFANLVETLLTEPIKAHQELIKSQGNVRLASRQARFGLGWRRSSDDS